MAKESKSVKTLGGHSSHFFIYSLRWFRILEVSSSPFLFSFYIQIITERRRLPFVSFHYLMQLSYQFCKVGIVISPFYRSVNQCSQMLGCVFQNIYFAKVAVASVLFTMFLSFCSIVSGMWQVSTDWLYSCVRSHNQLVETTEIACSFPVFYSIFLFSLQFF